MVTGYLISAVMAVLTVAIAGLIAEQLSEKNASMRKQLKTGKQKLLFVLLAVVYLGISLLFEAYGYSFWKKERYFILLCALFFLAEGDRQEHRIPNRGLAILFILRLAILAGEVISYPGLWQEFFLHAFGGAASSFILMIAAFFLSREKIGMGDVKLLTVMGFYLGFSLTYIVLLISLVFAAVWGLWNIWKKRVKMKDFIPFAPFLLVGLTVALGLGF